MLVEHLLPEHAFMIPLHIHYSSVFPLLSNSPLVFKRNEYNRMRSINLIAQVYFFKSLSYRIIPNIYSLRLKLNAHSQLPPGLWNDPSDWPLPPAICTSTLQSVYYEMCHLEIRRTKTLKLIDRDCSRWQQEEQQEEHQQHSSSYCRPGSSRQKFYCPCKFLLDRAIQQSKTMRLLMVFALFFYA